ncbi:NarL family transcriptional regulator [Micromonospora sp. WMMA2032]|uniref:NAD-dependent epimerase/dehydratase family protein n=1 Tax=Micromonospora sp. WMMA2032 TaxID=2039870 RepID=UPI000C05B04C|nr:NAD(P)-dependent oxidoreductase [Micromonospora sp. WMMA2032]ATO13952.1 NarL family transcriptional regulator [Micromonospora sp. WMMA2032]
MSRVLIFGASGFLGRHVSGTLAPEATLIRPPRSDCDLVKVTLPQLADLIRTARPTAVVNCTGRVGGTDHEMVQAHTLVTAKLIEAIGLAAPRARLVRIGSAAEYGPTPAGHPVRETDPVDPVDGYGLSHLTATGLVELAVRSGRLDGVVLRVFNAVGPGLSGASLLGRAARLIATALMRGLDTVVVDPLSAYRDLVDVRDVALAVRAAVRRPLLTVPVLNIGSGNAVQVREAVRALAAVAGFSGTLTEAGAGGPSARTVRMPWSCADVSLAGSELGWAPSYDLNDTVKALYRDVDGTAEVSLPKK